MRSGSDKPGFKSPLCNALTLGNWLQFSGGSVLGDKEGSGCRPTDLE